MKNQAEVSQEGLLWGLIPPGLVKSIDFREFSGPNAMNEHLPGKKKCNR